MKLKKKTLKFIALILFIIITIFLVRYFDLSSYLNSGMIKEKVNEFGFFAPLAFIVFYFIATIFFFPGTPLTIASGVIFGTFFGTIYAVIGAAIGASMAFLIVRYMGNSFVQDLIKERFVKLDAYDEKLSDNGFFSVIFLRLIPIFPFNGLNFSLGFTKIRFLDYFSATFLGIIPGSFILAYFGSSIVKANTINIILSSVLFIILIFSLQIYKYLKNYFKCK